MIAFAVGVKVIPMLRMVHIVPFAILVALTFPISVYAFSISSSSLFEQNPMPILPAVVITESDEDTTPITRYKMDYLQPRQTVYSQATSVSTHSIAQKSKTWLDKDFIERSFYRVALKNEYDNIDHPVRKWRKPIRIFLIHDVGDADLHTQLAHQHVRHLRQITRHSIKFVQHRHQANLIWVFSAESRWKQQVEQHLGKNSVKYTSSAVCIANYRARKTGEIIRASIVIPVDKARHRGKLMACIVEEITQTLGLPNDSNKVYPSIFNDHSPEELLSPLDITLLKLLYEPSVKIGTKQAKLQQVLKGLIQHYERTGQLKQSEQQAKDAPLYQLINSATAK